MASMSSPVPLPLVGAQVGPLNPLEGIIIGINTNPYFIGIMMLLLNLGGRFLGMEISKEQERFFQHPWVRRFLILTVLFVATRNIIVAFIMTIFVVLVLTMLLNENSAFYLGAPIAEPISKITGSTKGEEQVGLTPEEQDILRKLLEKQGRMTKGLTEDKKEPFSAELVYLTNMKKVNV